MQLCVNIGWMIYVTIGINSVDRLLKIINLQNLNSNSRFMLVKVIMIGKLNDNCVNNGKCVKNYKS